jgi:Ca2+-binding EF-hand superfamily protein
VEQETMDEIDAAFRALDVDNSGTLDKDDLVGTTISPNLKMQANQKDPMVCNSVAYEFNKNC